MEHAIHQDLWRGNLHRGDRIALRCGEQSLTYGQFFEAIRRAEAGLRAMGVRAGDVVTLFTLNTPESVIAFYAIDRIGAVANWVDMKLAPSEVEPYLTCAGSKVALVLELAFPKIYANRGAAPTEHFVVLPVGPYVPSSLGEKLRLGSWPVHAGEDCLAWEDFLAEPSGEEPETQRWEEPVAITYTGGTTGPAKGVTLSRRAFYCSLMQYTGAETEYGPGGATLTLLPVFSAFGLCQCIHVPLCMGMTVILAPLFLPHELGDLLVRYRPQQVSGTTSYWQLLLRSKAAERADLSFLKVPRSGGDAMTAEMERRINHYLAQRGASVRLIKEYGMSEVCGIVCLNHGDSFEVGSVGKPMEGCRIAVVDPETGEAVPDGVQGEILIHSNTVMNGYYGMPEADSQVLKPGPDGLLWVWTKDEGFRKEDGSIVITGRRKRMISRNGFKIFPSLIEECLLENEGVESCAVVGGESPRGERVPVAHIVASPGTDREKLEQTLRALCKQQLNNYMLPAAYFFREELPLTDRGKLDYLALEQETHL